MPLRGEQPLGDWRPRLHDYRARFMHNLSIARFVADAPFRNFWLANCAVSALVASWYVACMYWFEIASIMSLTFGLLCFIIFATLTAPMFSLAYLCARRRIRMILLALVGELAALTLAFILLAPTIVIEGLGITFWLTMSLLPIAM